MPRARTLEEIAAMPHCACGLLAHMLARQAGREPVYLCGGCAEAAPLTTHLTSLGVKRNRKPSRTMVTIRPRGHGP